MALCSWLSGGIIRNPLSREPLSNTQFSVNFFEFESFNIINELKRDNRIQFANFVDINKLKENYMFYI